MILCKVLHCGFLWTALRIWLGVGTSSWFGCLDIGVLIGSGAEIAPAFLISRA